MGIWKEKQIHKKKSEASEEINLFDIQELQKYFFDSIKPNLIKL